MTRFTRLSRTFAGGVFSVAATVVAVVPSAALADSGAPTTTTDPVPANPPAVPTNSNSPSSGGRRARVEAPTENAPSPAAAGGATGATRAPDFGAGPAEVTTESATSLTSAGGDLGSPNEDAQRYADLEASSGQVGDFRGGSAGIYIGIGSGAAIVLLVILLVILL